MTSHNQKQIPALVNCMICGCTDDAACIGQGNRPCYWVAKVEHLGVGVCSNCVAPRPEALLREPLAQFSLLMEETLAANDHKRGWEHDTLRALFNRLIEEADELVAAIHAGDIESIPKEAADVANFAMMISDNALRSMLGLPIPLKPTRG